ncbi:MAG: hypothetical protein ACTTKL_06970 [Treponema sp.]
MSGKAALLSLACDKNDLAAAEKRLIALPNILAAFSVRDLSTGEAGTDMLPVYNSARLF